MKLTTSMLAPVLLWVTGVVNADTVLSIAATHANAGGPIELVLTITNPTPAPLTTQLDDSVHVQVQTSTSTTTVAFTPERAGKIEVAPGAFAQVKLKGALPADIQGTATLAPTGVGSNGVLLQIDAAVAVADAGLTKKEAKQNAIAGEGITFDKPPPLAISSYEPTYIVLGDRGGFNAKFQLSLRYRLFDKHGALAQRLPWIDDVYLAYSQTSLWDLGEASKPFKDSSYRPRLFYANYDLFRLFDGRLRLGVESGLGHESNGKDGADSRSFNMLYVRPALLFGDPEGFRVYLAPLIHNYLSDGDNDDIRDYRGYVDWEFGVGSLGGLDFSGLVRAGQKSNRYSTEFAVRYPLGKLSSGALTGWLMLQYFDGYGENLLEYNLKTPAQWRLGIAIAQ